MNTPRYEKIIREEIERERYKQTIRHTPLHPRVEIFYRKWGRNYAPYQSKNRKEWQK